MRQTHIQIVVRNKRCILELGLIDREGRVSTQLGGDAETLPITSPRILAW